MMKQFKIKDNSEKKKEDFSTISNVTEKIADKTLGELEKEGVFVFSGIEQGDGGLTKEQIILQSYNNFYRTGNVMGFLGYGDERLVIESRFGSANNDYFLQYMLQHVLDFPSIINLETEANSSNNVLNLLVFLFPRYLKNAMRKGLLKIYIHKNYNNSNPKGAINIARHIKENTPFVGNIAYSQREHSYDNFLIELIRHTIEFIKNQSYGSRLLAQVKDEVKLIIEATQNFRPYDKLKIILENKKNIIRHAYFKEYRTLQSLCVLILQSKKQQIGSGTNRVYGLLFDGAWLWEEYIASLVKGTFYHPMNKNGKGAQRLFSGNVGLIYPDFISRNDKERVIADAKYKPIGNIGNNDYLQMLAYMLRFDAKTGIYFYPESNKNTSELRLKVNKGSTYEKNVMPREDMTVVKYGFSIPTEESCYDEFSYKMKMAEENFENFIKSFESQV